MATAQDSFGALAYRSAPRKDSNTHLGVVGSIALPRDVSLDLNDAQPTLTTLVLRPASSKKSASRLPTGAAITDQIITRSASVAARATPSQPSSSRSSSGLSTGIKKRSTSTKEHERSTKNLARGVKRMIPVPRTPSENIMDQLCYCGKLTNAGLNFLDRILWDFEIGYADAGPSCGLFGCPADSFCGCTMKDLNAWSGSLGHFPTENDEKPSIALLLRAYFETFNGLFQEKRNLEYSEMSESAYEIEKQIYEMKARFSHRAQENFATALWEHFLAKGWNCCGFSMDNVGIN